MSHKRPFVRTLAVRGCPGGRAPHSHAVRGSHDSDRGIPSTLSEYIVYLAVSREELGRLAHAAEHLADSFQLTVLESDSGDLDEPELAFRVEAPSPEAAMKQAERVYLASRREADLPVATEPPRMSTGLWTGSS